MGAHLISTRIVPERPPTPSTAEVIAAAPAPPPANERVVLLKEMSALKAAVKQKEENPMQDEDNSSCELRASLDVMKSRYMALTRSAAQEMFGVA